MIYSYGILASSCLKKMKRFYSISQYPGTFGKYYYSKFFEYLNIDAVYNPLGVDNIYPLISEIFESKADGISISMPFKKQVISYIKKLNTCVEEYNSCNTISLEQDGYKGYNTDLAGCEYFVSFLNNNTSILGNGCIGNMIAKLADKNNLNFNIYSRSLDNWNDRYNNCETLVNCTSFGTSTEKSPVDYLPSNCKMVLDVSLKDNNLKKLCAENNVQYVSGLEFYKKQFEKQFQIYNNIIPDLDYFDYLTANKETV